MNMPPIDISEAIRRLDQAAQALTGCEDARNAPVQMPLQQAINGILAEPVIAAADHPPFDQSLRDGVAVRSQDGHTDRHLVSRVMAGEFPVGHLQARQAAIVMTGAPIPDGADAVQMIEQVAWLSASTALESAHPTDWRPTEQADGVRLLQNVTEHQNILKQASLYRHGQCLLNAGQVVTPQAIGLIASTGTTMVNVYPAPRASILVTGDEVVDPDTPLADGQIYNSNGPLLESLLRQFPINLVRNDHVPDSRPALESWFHEALEDSDLILTTGSVSAGQKDLLPELFHDSGLDCLFHGVRIKPGKPIWFGRHTTNDPRTVFVMGLPGNPVSCFVGFHVFVRRLLAAQPYRFSSPGFVQADLDCDYQCRGNRVTFWPGVFRSGDPFSSQTSQVKPLDWKGSADLVGPAGANCLIMFDPALRDDGRYLAGENVWILPC